MALLSGHEGLQHWEIQTVRTFLTRTAGQLLRGGNQLRWKLPESPSSNSLGVIGSICLSSVKSDCNPGSTIKLVGNRPGEVMPVTYRKASKTGQNGVKMR